jgi:hypothetical protein
MVVVYNTSAKRRWLKEGRVQNRNRLAIVCGSVMCYDSCIVTLSSLVVALDKAGQKELAQSKYNEGRRLKIVYPWRWTRNQSGEPIAALVSVLLGT